VALGDHQAVVRRDVLGHDSGLPDGGQQADEDVLAGDRRPPVAGVSVVLGTVVVVIGQPATFHVAVESAMPESGVHLTVVALTPFGTWKTTAPVCDSPVLSLSRLLVPE